MKLCLFLRVICILIICYPRNTSHKLDTTSYISFIAYTTFITTTTKMFDVEIKQSRSLSRFENFPGEIRNQIYSLVLHQNTKGDLCIYVCPTLPPVPLSIALLNETYSWMRGHLMAIGATTRPVLLSSSSTNSSIAKPPQLCTL